MIREGHENTDFFVGTEIEVTPAHDKPTLFVVGLQPVDIISWKLEEVNVIVSFANHCSASSLSS